MEEPNWSPYSCDAVVVVVVVADDGGGDDDDDRQPPGPAHNYYSRPSPLQNPPRSPHMDYRRSRWMCRGTS